MQTTLLNGHRHSWTSIRLEADGLPINGITSLNYSDSLEPGKPMGTDPVALGQTRGVYSAECTIEMYRDEWETLKVTRLGLLGIGFGETNMVMLVAYFEPGLNGGEPFLDTIQGRVSKVESANSQGNEASKVSITLSIVQPILWDGVPIVAPDPTSIDVAL